MTLRLAFTVFASTAGLALSSAALAQTGPIEQRQALMKENGRDAKAATAILKGEAPFDAAKAAAMFASMNNVAKKYGGLFPANSKTGGDTEAAPAIWEKPAEFKAAVVKFEADTAKAMAAKPANLEAFKGQFLAVAANCKSCHESFRIKTD